MTWETLYERFWDWSDSTLHNRISSLKEFGPSDEVCDVADNINDVKIATRFIRKAAANGVTFNADDIYRLEGIIEEELRIELLKKLTGNMSWESFYEHFLEWSDDMQNENAVAQKEFGPSEEVCEIACSIMSDAAAASFVKNAVSAGVKFTAKQISDELVDCVDDAYVPTLVDAASTKFTKDEFDIISWYLDEANLKKTAERSQIVLDEEIEEDGFAFEPAAPKKRGGFSIFGLAAALLLAPLGVGKKRKKGGHNGRCSGDCANCPPHYGYRYGRWYYGRHHHYGCQFGGNYGGGGID